MKMKKVLCVLMATMMMFSMAACGSKDNDDSSGGTSDPVSQTDNDDNDNTKTEDTKSDGEEDTTSGDDTTGATGTLKVAAVETAYGQDSWKAVCKAFEESHDGVTVELTINKKLADTISQEMKSQEFPDVILHSLGAESGLTETFIKDNNLAELTDVLSMKVPGEDVTVNDKILPGFTDNSIIKPYGDGKTYLMPMFYAPCGLFYNQGLFKEKGWNVPETWDEMWELGDKAKAENIALFTYPTAGYFDTFLYSLLYESMGSEDFQKALKYEEGIWDTDSAQKVFDIIEKLTTYTEKTTPANANDNDYLKNQQLVLDNKALFMPNGNWVMGEMAEAPREEGFEWGFTSLPAIEKDGDRASYTYFEQVWVPAGAENQDLAKEFIAFLYSDTAADIFATQSKTAAVQPVQGMTDKLDGDNKLIYSIYDGGAIAVMDAFATTDPVEGITVRTTFLDPINSLVTGDKTKDDWIKQIKSDSDALRAALK